MQGKTGSTMLSDLLSHMHSWEPHSPVVHDNLELYTALPPSSVNTTSKMVSSCSGGNLQPPVN